MEKSENEVASYLLLFWICKLVRDLNSPSSRGCYLGCLRRHGVDVSGCSIISFTSKMTKLVGMECLGRSTLIQWAVPTTSNEEYYGINSGWLWGKEVKCQCQLRGCPHLERDGLTFFVQLIAGAYICKHLEASKPSGMECLHFEQKEGHRRPPVRLFAQCTIILRIFSYYCSNTVSRCRFWPFDTGPEGPELEVEIKANR